MSHTHSFAPARAKSTALARPMPLAAPVTTTSWFANSPLGSRLLNSPSAFSQIVQRTQTRQEEVTTAAQPSQTVLAGSPWDAPDEWIPLARRAGQRRIEVTLLHELELPTDVGVQRHEPQTARVITGAVGAAATN